MAVLAAVLAALAVALAVPGSRGAARRLPARRADTAPERPPTQAAEAPTTASVGLRAAVAAGAGAAVLLLVPGPVGLAGSLVAAGVGWWRSAGLEPASARHRRERLEAELPHVVDLVLSAVAVGAAPGEALSRVAEVVDPPVRAELAVWVRRLALGADPASVWRELAEHPQLGRLGRALHRSAESGAPVLETLEHLAEDLRARRRSDVETRVRQVEVRASVPLGVCLLPAFVLVGVVPLVAGALTGFLGAGG